MADVRQTHLVHLATVYGSFPAHVLAARLQDEGIGAELRGSVDSAYAFSVGEMSRIDVLVPDDELDDARLVMLSVEVEDAFEPSRSRRATLPWPWWVVAVVVLAASIAPLIHFFVTAG